ncbi:hypothetical protein ACTFIW_012934 [Dictyostelium discoideum]
MCVHYKYNFEDLFQKEGSGTWFAVISEFMRGDLFPDIKNGCSEECKKKMIQYTRAVFKNYMNSVCWYYNDVNIPKEFDDNGASCFSNYTHSLVDGFKEENSCYFNYTPHLENNSSKFPDYPNTLDIPKSSSLLGTGKEYTFIFNCTHQYPSLSVVNLVRSIPPPQYS